MTEIKPRLFLGTLPDSIKLSEKEPEKWKLIYCADHWPSDLRLDERPRKITHFPLLVTVERNTEGLQNQYAPLIKLQYLSNQITMALNANRNVLLHCDAGVERSPLVITWYLTQTDNKTFDEAFEYVKKLRPIVQDRRVWLTREVKEFLHNQGKM